MFVSANDFKAYDLDDVQAQKLWSDLKSYVGASDNDDAYVKECLLESSDLVKAYVGNADIPATVLGRAIMEVGSELYHRRNAPNGIAQFAAFDGSAIRVARDPLVGAYPILARFIGAPIA